MTSDDFARRWMDENNRRIAEVQRQQEALRVERYQRDLLNEQRRQTAAMERQAEQHSIGRILFLGCLALLVVSHRIRHFFLVVAILLLILGAVSAGLGTVLSNPDATTWGTLGLHVGSGLVVIVGIAAFIAWLLGIAFADARQEFGGNDNDHHQDA